ncbi:MAG: UTP--glucose-1-phosphate uridylyltransferase [Nitrospiraceae bacterium]|nr:MAG: UTP--glucose-1-phosphate uridylyltransferase [Nitrospiraceae bacterium]
MSNKLIETIVSTADALRNRSITDLLHNRSFDELLKDADELEQFRRSTTNLYHKVRASLFLSVIYRFYLQNSDSAIRHGQIPFTGIKAACDRDFETSIDIYLDNNYQNGAVFSALADAYYKLSFKYLLDQVKLSISECRENYHLYNITGLDDYPFAVPDNLTIPCERTGNYPVGKDASPVRLDPSHSGWSDIFFLGMDFPEGAKVINMSVDLRVHGSSEPVMPPCECYCRYIDEAVIHLISVDLKSSKKISSLRELFNFGNDYLSLLKAGVVASGIVPPSFEDRDIALGDILTRLLKKPGGIEIVTRVRGIPKGSRLAVSTTLLATIITRLMRFSGQIKHLTGPLQDSDRRIIASRAILGEWLGGSGGGWQDSGGLWPGIKVITGQLAKEGHPEYGVSRGCLLPEHAVFNRSEISEEVEKRIISSLILVHGGISQDVGPILEMVTEKYLLKYEEEWNARLKGLDLFDHIVMSIKNGDMKRLGSLTTEDWENAIQKVIPWVNNAFTEELIHVVKHVLKQDFWGFLMLGGMSGGGMAFIVNPKVNEYCKNRILDIMTDLKQKYHDALPFIIDPVAYDFKINHKGAVAELFVGEEANVPEMNAVSDFPHPVSPLGNGGIKGMSSISLDEGVIRHTYGFDQHSHKHMKDLLKKGDIGLSKNRLPISTIIEDIAYDDILHFENEYHPPFSKGDAGGCCTDSTENTYCKTGLDAIRQNEIAVVTFAGGMGSRWSRGSSVIKPVSPFIRISGKYRTFIELHIAKTRMSNELSGTETPHIFTTSYLTHDAISDYLERQDYFGYPDRVYLSHAKSIGHRVYPMEQDLRFYWLEQIQQKMDDNVQKVLDAAHEALIQWAKSKGEGEDYRDNQPILRFNPPGHWHEIPNLIRNGVLAGLLQRYPDLKYLFCHNVDTLGASLDPSLCGMHIKSRACLSFEVTPRRIEDAGGGLARVNGKLRLMEGMALPREEDEYKLSFYNTLTNWITIDPLLAIMGLDRETVIGAESSLKDRERVKEAIHAVEKKIPTYVTIKNVKYIWGNGQEDHYPVAQFEKLWGDMTGLDDIGVSYVSVSRFRGQQLKEPSLLDIWTNDGSLEYLKSLVLLK